MSKKKNGKNRKMNSKGRLAILFVMISLLLLVCLSAGTIRMIRNRESYRKIALRQTVGSVKTISAKPGVIMDTNGTLLASVKKVYRLILDPKVLADTEKTAAGSTEATISLLADCLELPEEELRSALTDDTTLSYVRFQNTVLSEEEKAAWDAAVDDYAAERDAWNEEHTNQKIKAKIAGVWFEEEYRREYPLGSLLSKVIGYTTEDLSEGILGLELYYNDVLTGTDGQEYSYVDSSGKIQSEVASAQDGLNLVTSLDANVAEAVRDSIREFQEEIGGERVNVLVMKPKTGEIVAIESDTEFDLNDPTDLTALFTEEELESPQETFLLKEAFKGEEKTAELEAMSLEEQQLALLQQVQINYAVSGTYEPGSTAKSLTISAGIEEGILDPEETFYCDGTIGVGNYTIHCHMDTLCGDLTPMEALGRSCNVCLVQMGQKIGVNTFSRYQKIYNLGQKTGIDLPGESSAAGLLYDENTMHDIELATGSFGQGFNVTMIQMACAYASIVNGGYYYEPHIVTAVTDNDGNVVSEYEPLLIRRTISEETSEYMKEALRYVTTFGTAAGTAATEGYTMGGKTGASEKIPRSEKKYVVSFIGAAPIEDPEILIYAVVEEPHVEDQSMSAPAQLLARKCFERLYSYYGIYPEDEADAYTYDWSELRDSSGESDAAGGEENISEETSGADSENGTGE